MSDQNRLPMTIHRLKPALLLLALAASLGSGCMGLSPKPDPTRHFILTPTSAKSATRTDLKVLVQEVEIPEYLNRSNLVLRKSPQEVVVSEYDRWAEPLEFGITRVLATNLSALLGTPTVYDTSRLEAQAEYLIFVAIRSFEPSIGPAGNRVRLSASWRLVNREDRELAAGTGEYPTPITQGTNSDRYIAGMSAALSELAGEIAVDVARHAHQF
jgi:uncharacterized protein